MSKRYVTDLKGYSGPVDDISPYHYYQHIYWNLRGKWRRILYDWTRRAPADATARITPTQTMAGERVTLSLEIILGKTPLGPGGRIAVYFPMSFGGIGCAGALSAFQGPDGERGYGARITSHASCDGVSLITLVHSTGSVFTVVEVIVAEGTLAAGDVVTILIGDPACKPPMVCEKAKTFPFRVAIDHAGDGEFRPVLPHPSVTNVGHQAHYLRCFAPATPRVGERFAIHVVAADLWNHNPSHVHQGQLTITATGGEISGPRTVTFPLEAHGSLVVPGLAVQSSSVTRIQVCDETNGLMGQTNPICPEAAPAGLSLYYGEIHSHTELSDGSGTPEDSYRWARDVEGLDFAALADHFEDGQSYNYTLADKWHITREVTEAFHRPGEFVTLLGYEIGTLEAHRNVYFADGVGRMIVEGPGGEKVTMDNVYAKLAETDYILIPHAPKFHGINWHRPHDPDHQRLVEICSWWGVSEEGGPLSVQEALDLGYKFGFTGGTDNHYAEAGNPYYGGITGVYAASLTRRAIFDALMARRTIATTGPRMIITFALNGALLGSELTLAADMPRHIAARAITVEPVQAVEVIRNGEVVCAVAGEGRRDVPLLWTDTQNLQPLAPPRQMSDECFAYYYLRVRTVTGTLGWASPIWVHLDKEA